MSDDEQSDSDATMGAEDVSTTGLIATRAKRSTAGNLYASLRANLDDEEIQRDLLAEDEEEDAGDYEGSDAGDDEAAFDSSDDEEDAGPLKEGEEDLEGEKELKKVERAEIRKKRKVQDARLKLPAWQKKSKKVKLADDVKTGDETTTVKPKKKSERANWLPTAADAPTRQSGRSLAVANREVIHANLKQSYERSEKQRRVMKVAAEREKSKKRAELSQEQRMQMCEKIAKQTEKEFGRWEREEAERQRLRDEALAARRARGLEGPYIRHWSGSVLWVGNQIKDSRIRHGSKKIEELKEEAKKEESPAVSMRMSAQSAGGASEVSSGSSVPGPAPSLSTSSAHGGSPAVAPLATTAVPSTTADSRPPQTQTQSSLDAPVPFLPGIHDYASQPATPPASVPAVAPAAAPAAAPASAPAPAPPAPPPQKYGGHPAYNPYIPTHPIKPITAPPPPALAPAPSTITYHTPPTITPTTYPTWPPGSTHLHIPTQPPPAPIPLPREQAQRSLILLDQFPALESQHPHSKRSNASTAANTNKLIETLLPDSHPLLTPEEQRYLHSHRRKLPQAPRKPFCAVIPSDRARCRDPKTGLFYKDLSTYKIIQRVLAGGCQWSGLLGAWVGPVYMPAMGRAAKGVPPGFDAVPAIREGKEGGIMCQQFSGEIVSL